MHHYVIFRSPCRIQTPSRPVDCRARPMYRHTDVYRPIWRCCRCIVSAKFRRYISAIFVHKSVALALSCS